MTSGMSADEYTAQFKILVGHTGFNDEALKDGYAQGLPPVVLGKIHTQPSLPSILSTRKETAHWIDQNYCQPLKIKQTMTQHTSSCTMPFQTSITSTVSIPMNQAPPALKSTTSPALMDINSNHHQLETQMCYNCGKQVHISPQFQNPRKERVCANITDIALAELVAESVVAVLKLKMLQRKKHCRLQARKGNHIFRLVNDEKQAPFDR